MNLRVGKGTCIGILGANGSGKSTFLSVLAGVLGADGGQFLCDGVDLLKDQRRRARLVGYVPQGTPLIEEFSARDNLLLWYDRDRLRTQLEEGVLELLGIREFLKVPVSKMSGGMKKRLSIGCAMAAQPPILLLSVMAVVLRRSNMLPAQVSAVTLFLGLIPTLLMAASLSYCLYTLSGQLVGGILLSFFAVLLLGFAGGCMYPVQVFPLTMRRLAAVLPSGIARQSITGCLWGETPAGILPLLGYSTVFLTISVGLRSRRTGSVWR